MLNTEEADGHKIINEVFISWIELSGECIHSVRWYVLLPNNLA